MPQNHRRIHITGGPGSGKSTLAKRLSAALNIPWYDLDRMALDLEAKGVRPPFEALAAELPGLVQNETWISDGAYMAWAQPLFDSADLVIWMDIPWHIASLRIVIRHLKAEIARNNRFPGWRRLYRFWRWSNRYYNNGNSPGFYYGVPNNRDDAVQWLEAYRSKLDICRTNADQMRLFERLTDRREA